MASTGDQKAKKGLRDFELGGGQGTGGLITAVTRADEVLARIAGNLAIHSLRGDCGGGFAECITFNEPFAKAVRFEGVKN
jgi:hypothetical protein